MSDQLQVICLLIYYLFNQIILCCTVKWLYSLVYAADNIYSRSLPACLQGSLMSCATGGVCAVNFTSQSCCPFTGNSFRAVSMSWVHTQASWRNVTASYRPPLCCPSCLLGMEAVNQVDKWVFGWGIRYGGQKDIGEEECP